MPPKQISGVFILLSVFITIGLVLAMSFTLLGQNEPISTATPAKPPTAATKEDEVLITPTQTSSLEVTRNPTATFQPTKMPTSTATAVCQLRTDWYTYTVRSGDTLSQIAAYSQIGVDLLLAGNCRASTIIYSGETLRVPRAFLTITPSSTLLSSPTHLIALTPGVRPTQSSSDGLCLNLDSNITGPQVGAILHGNQSFYGSAGGEDFVFYKLEIRQEDETTNEDFITFYTSTTPVADGLLGILLTEDFADGEYWIRLVVVDQYYNYLERCSILYTIQN